MTPAYQPNSVSALLIACAKVYLFIQPVPVASAVVTGFPTTILLSSTPLELIYLTEVPLKLPPDLVNNF